MISIQAFAAAPLAALIAISAVAEAQDGAKTPATAPPAPIDGEWVVADKTARIRIAPCGDGGDSIRCGTLSWTRTPGGVDSNNPDPAKRNQPLLGVELIKGMRLKSQNRWEGSVYNARDGKTYDAALVPQSPTTVKIEGCVLGGLLCAGETWTRGSDITGLIGTMPPASARPRSVQPR
jgi:uncharacterized protein (DUF2147 family)